MKTLRVGVISDTHGLMRPEALQALAGADRLLHAGDIGAPEVLEALNAIAPVTAVRGNNDRAAWANGIPGVECVELGGVRVHLLHDLKELAIDPVAEGIRVVVSGHSHKPKVEWQNAVLFLNPGSAGPRRFRLPVTVAWMELSGGQAEARVVELMK